MYYILYYIILYYIILYYIILYIIYIILYILYHIISCYMRTYIYIYTPMLLCCIWQPWSGHGSICGNVMLLSCFYLSCHCSGCHCSGRRGHGSHDTVCWWAQALLYSSCIAASHYLHILPQQLETKLKVPAALWESFCSVQTIQRKFMDMCCVITVPLKVIPSEE